MNLALFDLDNTLIAGDSDTEWPKFLIKRGILDPEHHARQNDLSALQCLGGALQYGQRGKAVHPQPIGCKRLP